MHDYLYFNEQHLAVRETVRAFARDEVAPVAAHYDATAEFPWPTIKRMGELGFLGVPWPEELGGSGLDILSYVMVIHELAKVDASHGLTISAHTTLGTSPIVNFGTAQQKKRYVPLLASGRVLGGFGLTEESAGSDAAGTRTRAVKKGDRYVINGSKRFITHAGVGEIFVVTAVTEPGKGTHGISSFILTKHNEELAKAKPHGIGHDESLPAMPGFTTGRKEDKLGWRASDTRELIMTDVEVPADQRLGDEGEGFINFMKTLDSGRIGIGALSLGIAEGAFEQALRYATVRKQFGQAIAEFQAVQHQLARAATDVHAARLMVYEAARLRDLGRSFLTEAAMCKLFSSEMAERVTSLAVNLFGGNGFVKDYPVEKLYRDAKIGQIYEGTSNLQLQTIAKQMLG